MSRRRHRSCGLRPGPRGRVCARCLLVDAYRDAREVYLDAVEVADPGGDPVLPVVTFGWWLRQWRGTCPPAWGVG